jgi:ribosomal protein L40E
MKGELERRLEYAIEAARTGDLKRARDNLIHIIELDEWNEDAWMWLSTVVESRADKIVCLENVLTINPDNVQAVIELQRAQRLPPDGIAPLLPRLTRPRPAVNPVCPRCGYRNPAWAYLCDRCGASLRPVDVRKAVAAPAYSWTRTLGTLLLTLVFVPLWRSVVMAVLWLSSSPGLGRDQLIAGLLRCVTGSLVPALFLTFLGLPLAFLTFPGARLLGGRGGFDMHLQLTLVASFSWVLLLAFLSPLASFVSHLAGEHTGTLAEEAMLFVLAVSGVMGVIWLTQAVRAAQLISAWRALLAVVVSLAVMAAVLSGIDLAAIGGADVWSIPAVLFSPCM